MAMAKTNLRNLQRRTTTGLTPKGGDVTFKGRLLSTSVAYMHKNAGKVCRSKGVQPTIEKMRTRCSIQLNAKEALSKEDMHARFNGAPSR